MSCGFFQVRNRREGKINIIYDINDRGKVKHHVLDENYEIICGVAKEDQIKKYLEKKREEKLARDELNAHLNRAFI